MTKLLKTLLALLPILSAPAADIPDPPPRKSSTSLDAALTAHLQPSVFEGYDSVGGPAFSVTVLAGERDRNGWLIGLGPHAGISYFCYEYGVGTGIGFVEEEAAMTVLVIVDRRIPFRNGPGLRDHDHGNEIKLHIGLCGPAIEFGYMQGNRQSSGFTAGLGLGF